LTVTTHRRDDPPRPDRDPQPWFTSAFDQSYVDRYAHRDDSEARTQIDTLRRDGHLRTDGLLLDLCCGAGRHLKVLREAGIHAVGADLSADLIRAARGSNPDASLLRADMGALPFAGASFSTVVQMFTAFGYFETDRENQGVLAEVSRVLTSGGTYALDLMNRTPLIETLVPESSTRMDDGSIVDERRSFDPVTGRVNKRIDTLDASGKTHTRHESVRVLTPAEITDWMAATGLEVIAMYGDYSGAHFNPEESPRMLVVAANRSP